MKWIKYLILTLLITLSLPVERLEQRSGVEVSYPIGEGTIEPVELPVKDVDEEELHCMALAVFKEGRSEPIATQIAIAQTILNRVHHKSFPNTVCKVVKQKLKGNCMFSWWCYKDREQVNDIKSYNKAHKIAYKALLGEYKHKSTSHYFKLCSHKHKFFDKLEFRGKIGATCFYREYK